MSKCKVCGKDILSKSGRAELCQDKSTCRVAWSRKQKRAQKEAEKMTITLDQYALYEVIFAVDENVAGYLNKMLYECGKEAFEIMLRTCAYMLKVSAKNV